MAGRRPLAVGLGLGAVYLVAAAATLVLSDRPFRPLYDGLAPPLPYRWVVPPPEVARDNQQPVAARREFPLGPDGSPFVNVTPEDGQAVLLLAERAVPARPPDTSVEVAVTPLDVRTLGALPPGRNPESNAYQVTLTYRPSGAAAAEISPGTSALALVAAGPSDFLLYSRDGQAWEPRETQPMGSVHGLETPFAGPGYYVVTSIAGGGGGASPLVIAVVLLVPPLLVGGLVLRNRRAKAASTAAERRSEVEASEAMTRSIRSGPRMMRPLPPGPEKRPSASGRRLLPLHRRAHWPRASASSVRSPGVSARHRSTMPTASPHRTSR